MFKLLIECSKDIDELHINFSDGTSTVVEKPDKPKEIKEPKVQKIDTIKEPRKKLEQYLNTDEDFTTKHEIIEKPIIPDTNRPPKVSDELQNLDF